MGRRAVELFQGRGRGRIFKITETGIESPAITGAITGTERCDYGSLALSRADDYALTAAEGESGIPDHADGGIEDSDAPGLCGRSGGDRA